MEIHINAVLDKADILNFFSNEIRNSGIDPATGIFRLEAYSDKKNEWLEVKDIRIVFTNNK